MKIMLLSKTFCIILQAGALLINANPTVLGQTQEPTNPCESVEADDRSLQPTWSNASGVGLNCSDRYPGMPMNMSGNATAGERGTEADGNERLSIIDTGFVSKQTSKSIQTISSLVIVPVLISLGLIGNILSLRALFNQKPMDAIRVYLISLSIADILVLAISALISVQRILEEFNPWVGVRMRVALFSPAELFAKLLSTRISAFITVLLSSERCFAITFPFRVQQICLSRYPWRVVCFVSVGLIVFYIPNLFRFNVFLSEAGPPGKLLVVMVPSEFSRSVPLFYTYYGLAGQIFTAILPLVIVLVCNLAIIISLRASAKYRKTITTSQQEDNKLTRLLLTISAIFIVCSTPGIVVNLLVKVVPWFGFNKKEHYLYSSLLSISGTLVIVNSSVNFIVYMFLGENFRKSFFKTWGFARYLVKFTKSEAVTSDSTVGTVSVQIK